MRPLVILFFILSAHGSNAQVSALPTLSIADTIYRQGVLYREDTRQSVHFYFHETDDSSIAQFNNAGAWQHFMKRRAVPVWTTDSITHHFQPVDLLDEAIQLAPLPDRWPMPYGQSSLSNSDIDIRARFGTAILVVLEKPAAASKKKRRHKKKKREYVIIGLR